MIQLSSSGKTDVAMAGYKDLYLHWNQNPLFLYNYGAQLNYIKKYPESSFVLARCENYLNDYDVQMLQAENYFNNEDWDIAEDYYKKALRMCPNRFLPLRGLLSIYDLTGRSEDALKVLVTIIEKPVKIESPFINRMKFDAKKRYDKYLNY